MRRTLLRSLGAVLVLALPALLALLALGRPAIRLLFEHGRFNAAAGALTYAVLVPYAVGLPAYVCTEVISRGLIALEDTRTPLITNSLQLAGRVVVITLLGTVLAAKLQQRLRRDGASIGNTAGCERSIG